MLVCLLVMIFLNNYAFLIEIIAYFACLSRAIVILKGFFGLFRRYLRGLDNPV